MKNKMIVPISMMALSLMNSGAAEVPKSNDTLMSRVSLEAIGAIKHVNFEGKAEYGAGAAVLYQFNKYVYGYGRALSYETDNWRGSTIDEAAAGVEAVFLDTGKFSLSAIGTVNRDFQHNDWGFGLGLCPAVKITDNVSVFGGYEVRLWDKQQKDGLATFGINFSF